MRNDFSLYFAFTTKFGKRAVCAGTISKNSPGVMPRYADIHLRYTDDDFHSYDNIFRHAKFDPTDADQQRLIDALKVLSSGENLETAINIDEVLRYFTVQVFVVNMDSYLGRTGHNYFLYEEDGILQILPWDYNLAFATCSLGMPDPINDSTLYVNYPINTPASGEVMKKRPLYHNLMKHSEYYAKYHEYFDYLIESYFESGYFETFVEDTADMIAPYAEKDPTAFCSFDDWLLGWKPSKTFACSALKASGDSWTAPAPPPSPPKQRTKVPL